MADEARSMWQDFISAPENAVLLKRYIKSAAEPEPLFDAIGADLGSTNEEIRRQAWWAFCSTMPELTNILHERESRQPGFREVSNADQRMVDRGLDILTHLYNVFVRDYRFRVDQEKGKDPRPYLNTIIRNWSKDTERSKDQKNVSLDANTSGFPLHSDSSTLFEDDVINQISYGEYRRELQSWGFLTPEEIAMFETVYVDDIPLQEAAKQLGIPSYPAARKRMSRVRAQATRTRDAILSSLFGTLGTCIWHPYKGNRMKFANLSLDTYDPVINGSKWWERATSSIIVGGAEEIFASPGTEDENAEGIILPITRGFKDVVGDLYIIAIRSDIKHKLPARRYMASKFREGSDFSFIFIGEEMYDGDVCGSFPADKFPGLYDIQNEMRAKYHLAILSYANEDYYPYFDTKHNYIWDL